jgi:hypothetical protein
MEGQLRPPTDQSQEPLKQLAALQAAHGREVLLAALERAVAFGRWRAADVRSILAAGAGIPRPRPPGDALVLELPVVPTRSLADYAIDRSGAGAR